MLTTARHSINFAKSCSCRVGGTVTTPRRTLENTLLRSSNHGASSRSWPDVPRSNGITVSYFHELEPKVDHGRACSSWCDVACALPRWSSSRRHEGYTLVPQTCCLPGDTLLCRLLGDLASTTSWIALPDRNSLRRPLSSQHPVFAALPLGRHLPIRLGRSRTGCGHQSLPLYSRRPIIGPAS